MTDAIGGDKLRRLGRSISVVVPACNEEQRLPQTLHAVHRFLSANVARFEIIVVDDGSRDATAAVCEQLAEALHGLRCLRLEANRGKGYAVRTGLATAHGDYLVFMDADGSTRIDELAALPELAPRGDIFVSSRYVPGSRVEVRQPLTRVVVSRAANAVIRTLAVPGIYDTQNGFKILTREAFRAVAPYLTIDRWAFDVELLLVARRLGLRIVEFPVTWFNSSDSRIRIVRDVARTSADFTRLQFNRVLGRYPRRASARTGP